MKEQKRKFTGVWIPREIWLSDDLSITEKALLTEINSLDNENGCIAGNPYFAKFFRVSTRQISKYMSQLKEKGYVKIEIIGKNRRRILMEQKFLGVGTKVPSEVGTKVPHSNTEENNTYNTLTPDKSDEGVKELFSLFQEVNPSIGKYFSRKNQWDALRRMVKIHGRELVEKAIKVLPMMNSQQYWKKSLTPIQLEDNWGWYETKKAELKNPQVQKSKLKVAIIT